MAPKISFKSVSFDPLAKMVLKSRKVFVSFASFFFILKIFGLLRFKAHTNRRHEFFSRLSCVMMAVIFVYILGSGCLEELLLTHDPVTRIAQAIDRSVAVIVAAIIYVEASLREKTNLRIFKGFQDIDSTLLHKFGLSFNYQMIKTSNYCLIIYTIFPTMLVARIVLAPNLDLLKIFLLAIVIFGILVVSILKMFYVAILVQFLIRFKAIENLIATKSEAFVEKHKFDFEGIYMKFFRLVDTFNESLGFTILTLLGGIELVRKLGKFLRFIFRKFIYSHNH